LTLKIAPGQNGNEPYKIKSKSIRFGSQTGKGYFLKAFKDAFSRYLPSDPPFQNVTPSQLNDSNALRPISKRHMNEDVTFQKPLKPAPDKDCDGVTDENRDKGGNEDIHRTEVTL